MKDGDIIAGAIYFAFGCLVLIFLIIAAPFAIAIAAVWAGVYLYLNSEGYKERQAKKKTHALYEAVCGSLNPLEDDNSFEKRLIKTYIDGDQSSPHFKIFLSYAEAADALSQAEGFDVTHIPTPPILCNTVEGGRYRDYLNSLAQKVGNPAARHAFDNTLIQAFGALSSALPAMGRQSRAERQLSIDEKEEATFTIPLVAVLPNLGAVVEDMILHFYTEEAKSFDLFAGLREQFDRNLHEASGVPYTPTMASSDKLVMPSKSKEEGVRLVHAYLRNTPFERVFKVDLPFVFPEKARFEHHWIVAGSGHGKTQTLQALFAEDLKKVEAGEASVVVIDSQRDLIKNLSRLDFFFDHADKLCLIDPSDIDHPPSLNLFDIGMARIKAYEPLDRERATNAAIELYDFIFGKLLSAELTQKQSLVFRYIVRLLLTIPDATIHTFRELMAPGGSQKFEPYIANLSGTAKAFFETEFNSKQFAETKTQIARRLWGVFENPTFERMFSHPKNKIDLFTELNSGKVILVNTAKELLKQTGTEIFGRFIIAMIAQAAQERANIAPEKRMPTFVYVDEAQDYLDHNISLILEQARKFKVGMILAHQYIDQLEPKLEASFAANTSIKTAGGVSERDARAFARMMRTEASMIEAQPVGRFATFVRNHTPSALSLRVPFGVIEKMPRMTDHQWAAVQAEMRQRYCAEPVTYAGPPPPPPAPPADTDAPAEW